MAEPAPRYRREEYRLRRLYLDDVRAIEDALRELDPSDVQITTEDWVAASVAELAEHHADDGPLHRLRFMTYGPPYITVDIHPQWVEFYVADTRDLVNEGVAARLDEIMSRASRPLLQRLALSRVGQVLIGLPLPLGLALGLAVVAVDASEGGIPTGVYVTALAVVALGSVGWLSLFWANSHGCVVHLETHAHRPGFFKRNHDQIGLILLTAAISFIAGFVLSAVTS